MMEKEHQPDSMATVAMKPDYPPSVYSNSEPPPAYRQPRSSSVQIARIVAVTIILSSMILGGFLLAASYVQARAGCQQLEQLDAMLEKELAYEARMQAEDEMSHFPPLPQALHQDAPSVDMKKANALTSEKKASHSKNEEKLQSLDDHSEEDSSAQSDSSASSDTDSVSGSDSDASSASSSSSDSDSDDTSEESNSAELGHQQPIRITLPLHLDLDDLAGALIEKNQRSRMNCVVEKRRAEELVDHQPRNVQLPFGLNLTTDPRIERVTGERMVIFCDDGEDSRDNRQEMPEGVEVMSGFPVPLGGPVRLPLHFPVPQAYRPPMPAQHMQAPAPQAPQEYQSQQQEMPQQRAFPPQFFARPPPQFSPQQPQQMQFQIREQMSPPQQMLFQIRGQAPHPQQMPFQMQREQMPPPQQMPFQIREQTPFQMREQEPQPQQLHFQFREETPRQQPQPQQLHFQFKEETPRQQPQQPQQLHFQIREEVPRQQPQPQQLHFQIREEIPRQQQIIQMRDQVREQAREQVREQSREHASQEQQIPFEIIQRIREITQQGESQSREQQIPVQFHVREQVPQERLMPFQMRDQNSEQSSEQVQIPRLPMQMALVPREVRIHVQRIQMPQVESDQVPQDSHVSEEEQSEMESMPMEQMPISAEDLRAVQQAVRAAEEDQEQEQRAHEEAQQAEEREGREDRNSMMERQAMARALPVNIPVPMMIQDTKEQDARPTMQDPERPHYVQPRSVRSTRSVDSLLHREKRVKRACMCDCAC